jgi:hypothetical protein
MPTLGELSSRGLGSEAPGWSPKLPASFWAPGAPRSQAFGASAPAKGLQPAGCGGAARRSRAGVGAPALAGDGTPPAAPGWAGAVSRVELRSGWLGWRHRPGSPA